MFYARVFFFYLWYDYFDMRPLLPDTYLFRSLLLNEKNILNGKK